MHIWSQHVISSTDLCIIHSRTECVNACPTPKTFNHQINSHWINMEAFFPGQKHKSAQGVCQDVTVSEESGGTQVLCQLQSHGDKTFWFKAVKLPSIWLYDLINVRYSRESLCLGLSALMSPSLKHVLLLQKQNRQNTPTTYHLSVFLVEILHLCRVTLTLILMKWLWLLVKSMIKWSA